jgi:hypothetical protein
MPRLCSLARFSGPEHPLLQRLEALAPEGGGHRFVANGLVVEARGERDVAGLFEQLLEERLAQPGGDGIPVVEERARVAAEGLKAEGCEPSRCP